MNNKWLIAGAVLLLGIFLAWLFKESEKPLPGELLLQEGRDHKPEGTKLAYKFNPPTSGDHYASWITKGFYGEPRADGNLVHTMEHGYIIIWYDCEKSVISHQSSVIREAYADSLGMTMGSTGSPSASLESMPKSFSDGSCNNLKNELKTFYEADQHKLVIMPRVGMDHPIILTAWGRMLKLDSLDQTKIKEFINSFRDQGPEHTNEP